MKLKHNPETKNNTRQTGNNMMDEKNDPLRPYFCLSNLNIDIVEMKETKENDKQ